MLACAGRDQRVMIGGCPCVVHGLRAAQPGEGDAFTSPQPGKRWATGGQPSRGGDRDAHLLLPATLNACGVEADASEPTASGRRSRRAAELRCSGRQDTTRQARDESPLRTRRDRESAATSSRFHRRHVACKRCAPRSRAPSSLRTASNAPAASGLSCPSALSRLLRSGTLGSCLALACAVCARAPGWLAGVQRVRWCRTHCTPAAPLVGRSPHPRIARNVRAPSSRCRARSRGSRRSVDITRDYAQASCLCGAARGVVPRESPRPRNPSLCHGPPARPCARQGAALPARRCSSVLHALRASARHPWLARFVQLGRVARGLWYAAPGRPSPRAGNANSGHQEAVNSQSPPRGGCRKLLAVVVSA